jgi:small nuclear ribonucleoprotein (snRNP)-like protein
MLVELKNGETLNGHLVTCDTWMNLTLREVVQTSPVGFMLYLVGFVGVRGDGEERRVWRGWEGKDKGRGEGSILGHEEGRMY